MFFKDLVGVREKYGLDRWAPLLGSVAAPGSRSAPVG